MSVVQLIACSSFSPHEMFPHLLITFGDAVSQWFSKVMRLQTLYKVSGVEPLNCSLTYWTPGCFYLWGYWQYYYNIICIIILLNSWNALLHEINVFFFAALKTTVARGRTEQLPVLLLSHRTIIDLRCVTLSRASRANRANRASRATWDVAGSRFLTLALMSDQCIDSRTRPIPIPAF